MEITQRLVKSLKAPDHGNVIHYDGDVPGFGVRITAAGAISFVLNYRIDGRERRYTIGRFPEFSADAARTEALNLRHEIRNGKDPLAQREATRSEPTIADLARDYMQEYALKNKRPTSIRNDRQMLEKIVLPRFKHLRVRAVERRDVERLHGSLKHVPYRANRVLALLSKMFTLAAAWNWRDDNPAHGIERYPEDHREVFLSIEQLRSLEGALQQY